MGITVSLGISVGWKNLHSSVAESKGNDCMRKTGRKISLCSYVCPIKLSFHIFVILYFENRYYQKQAKNLLFFFFHFVTVVTKKKKKN